MQSLDAALSRYMGWNVLRWFVRNPSSEIHVKQFAREQQISSSTASELLKELHRAGLLERRRSANALFYSMDNSSLVSRQLKRLGTVMELERLRLPERFLTLDDAVISLVLYGSYASGENDFRSDIDLLVLTGSKRKDYSKALKGVERVIGCESSLLVFSLASWMKLKKEDPGFYGTVLGNHLVLYGSQLP
jgi:predicted nucleotidyltransferase